MDTLDRLIEHDAWTTRQLLMLCHDHVDEASFTHTFEMGPGSLRDTFAHTIGTMEYWAERISDSPEKSLSCDRMVGQPMTPGTLLSRLDQAAIRLRRVAEDVRDSGRLDEMMLVFFEGGSYTFTRGIALVHVCTHGMHHRAQIINMLRQLGIDHGIEGDAISWEHAMCGPL
jgi:uncharacterized damage-inducible protein DinB